MISTESALIERYLNSGDPAEQDEILTALVFDNAAPAIRKIISRRLHGTPEQDRDDVAGDVILDLIARVKKLKQDRESSIDRFGAYAAVCAHNACDQYLRQRYPQRHRLKNRLRYLLGKMPGFAIWEDSERGWVCGRSSWKNQPPRAPDAGLVVLLTSRDQAPDILLAELFDRAATPIEFDSLVELVAAVLGIRDRSMQLELVEETIASGEPAVDDLMVQRQNLHKLWSEIVGLPPAQRTALLLNLRDPKSGSAVWLLPAAGIASIRQIAELVGIAAEDFACLWPRLPLSDSDIAQLLGVARQQVINLRQAARQRLARRLKTHDLPPEGRNRKGRSEV